VNSGPPSLLISSGTPNVEKYILSELINPVDPELLELLTILMISGQLLNRSTMIR